MSIITAITSGPGVNGNNETIVNSIIDGAMGLSTNIINLYRLDRLRYISDSDKSNDDISLILDSMKESDTVIFATPVVNGSISDYLNTLLNRIDKDVQGTFGSEKKTAFFVITCPDDKIGQKISSELEQKITGYGFIIDSILVYPDNDCKNAKNDEYILSKAKHLGLSLRNT